MDHSLYCIERVLFIILHAFFLEKQKDIHSFKSI